MLGYLDNTDGHPGHVEAGIAAEGQHQDRHLIATQLYNFYEISIL